MQFPHVITGAMATGGFFVLGVSAWHLRRASDAESRDAFARSFRIGAVYAFAATLAVMVVGHTQAQYMTRVQPMKMAAAEALWESANPAPMSLFTWGDEPGRKDVYAVKVPGLLSFLAYNRFAGEVRGIKDIEAEYTARYGPGDYAPPVKWTYWNFRAMVGAGMLMLVLAAAGAHRDACAGRVPASPRLARAPRARRSSCPTWPTAPGWIFTEIGRAPWIVFGLMKIENGVSPNVTAAEVLFTLVGFTLLYAALMAADIYLLAKFGKAGIAARPEVAPVAPPRAGTGLRGGDTMDLNTLWFVLIGVLFTGFFVLEGFDYGVGILLPFVGRTDEERRRVINTIGPVWDGNEVWILTGGGAIFAAFPHWYATLFSGFYLALFLILAALIVRGRRVRVPQQGQAAPPGARRGTG